jgi:peptide/nickel transport system substrate-binding protein
VIAARSLTLEELSMQLRGTKASIMQLAKALGLAALAGLAHIIAGTQMAEAGGVLKVGIYTDLNGFDIVKVRAFGPGGQFIVSSIMEGLFAYDYDRGNVIVPRLALNFNEAPDRMSVVVKLRPGVTFHDGTPFNAAAVVYHFDRILDPKSGLNVKETMFGPLTKVEEVDDLTVRFVLNRPWAALQSVLAVDQGVNMIGSPTALKADPEGFNRHPVGTGAFSFAEWQHGDHLTVKRYTSYWDRQLPYLDEVVYRVIPDENTRFQALRGNDLDIAWIDNPQQIEVARKIPELKVWENKGTSALIWILNTTRPPFDDVRARAAVVHAFNGQALVNGYFGGDASVAKEFFPNSEWACPNLRWRGYDLEASKAYLKQLGGKLEFTLNGYATPASRRASSIAQEFFGQAGIKADIKLLDPTQNTHLGLTGDFQMIQWRFSDFGGDPELYIQSASITTTRFQSREVDALLDRARSEQSHEARRDLYCQISQIYADQAIMIMPDHTFDFLVGKSYVENVPRNVGNLLRVRSVSLAEGHR